MPKGAKVLKDLLSHKEKLEKAASLVKLSEECSAIIQRSLPQKEGDPGSFTLPCLIRPLAVKNALADLGASSQVFPDPYRSRRSGENHVHLPVRNLRIQRNAIRIMQCPRNLSALQSNLEGLVSNFMASQDSRLSKFEADFKQQQSEMTNKINTVLKTITDRMDGALLRDTVKNPKLNVNSTSPVLSARSYPIVDPQCSSHPSTSINAVKTCSKEASHSQTNQLQTGIGIGTQQIEEPKQTLEDEFQNLHINLPVLEVIAHAPIYNVILGNSKPFDTLVDLGSCVNIIPLYLFKKLNIRLLEETDHIFGLTDGTKSYPVRIVKDVEVHIGKLNLLNNFYVIDMKKDHETPFLVGRGFLATANVVIDCRKTKIVVGEGITRSVFGVKGVDLGEEEAPYWTTIGKRESYKPRPSSDGIETRTPYYARKDFLDSHLPREWEISWDAEINPFKDVLVFRRMVEFLEAIPINLKRNMCESEDLIQNQIDWNKPPKNRDGAWHAKIRLINSDGEEFTKTLQSIPTSRKLSKRESPREIINLDHFYDTKFFKENEKKIFSEAGDGVRIYPDGVVIFDEKKLGSS
ncbi:MAK10-like protein [Tanacetum coccineum]